MEKKTLTVLGLIMLGILGRCVPHLPNATPITAITIAANRHLGRIWTVAIPLIAMVLSDLIIGVYSWKIMLSVYGSFFLISLINVITRKYRGHLPTCVLIFCSSLLFFLVTNFAVWIFSSWYEKTVYGLLYCFSLGIPFLRNMLIGDVIYTSLILGGYKIFNIFPKTNPFFRFRGKLFGKFQNVL